MTNEVCVKLPKKGRAMILTNVNAYLNARPSAYNRINYDLFLSEVGGVSLNNAIYITGTNGKGSTAFFLFETFRAAKLNVAIFSSPHFASFQELAKINDDYISNDVIAEYIAKYDSLFEKYKLSSFEIMTFISLHYFSTLKLDYVIVEAGLGVKVDATNIFTPSLSVITNIKNDHLALIGPTLLDVAKSKGAIIHPFVPLFIGELTKEVEPYILDLAKSKDAPIYYKNEVRSVDLDSTGISVNIDHQLFKLNTLANYEVNNVALAHRILTYLQTKDARISLEAMKQGFWSMHLPGRFTIVNQKPLMIVDGAHNPHAIVEVINNVKKIKHQNLYIVFAAFKDKDIKTELDLLALSGAKVVLTTFEHPRAATTYENSSFTFIPDYQEALEHQKKKMKSDDLLLVIGSLYFACYVVSKWEK